MRSNHRFHSEDILIPAQEPAPCSICGKEAHYVEISFMSPICSTDCAKSMWKQYVDTQVSRKYKTIEELSPNPYSTD